MKDESDALEKELMAMEFRDRLNAIATDLRSRSNRYRNIDPHRLRSLMHVPEPQPESEWSYLRDAVRLSIEEWLEMNGSGEQLVDHLSDGVDARRREVVAEAFEALGDFPKRPDLSFLLGPEREMIESALQEKELDELGGGFVVARICIGSPMGVELWFEGDIEDDGTCVTLRTPYEHRDGDFKVISDLAEEYQIVTWQGLISRAIH